jgi:hypothetical protein
VCAHTRTVPLSEIFAAVREAFSIAYSDREIANRAIYRPVTTLRDTGSIYYRQLAGRRIILTGDMIL